MPIPIEEERLLFQQHVALFVVYLSNEMLIRNGKVLYALTNATIETPGIIVSLHSMDIKDDNHDHYFYLQ
jgi:hypothetical protein